jgi:hypothetical protein
MNFIPIQPRREKKMEIINEHKIGVAKGTIVEQDVSMNFKGETSEVGIYLAMARQAQR